jgi:hypothetical protein
MREGLQMRGGLAAGQEVIAISGHMLGEGA